MELQSLNQNLTKDIHFFLIFSSLCSSQINQNNLQIHYIFCLDCQFFICRFRGVVRLQKEKVMHFPMAPMGVLAPGSVHSQPSARHPIETRGNLRRTCLQSHLQTFISLNLFCIILPTPGEAKAKAMPGRLYTHTKINNNK